MTITEKTLRMEEFRFWVEGRARGEKIGLPGCGGDCPITQWLAAGVYPSAVYINTGVQAYVVRHSGEPPYQYLLPDWAVRFINRFDNLELSFRVADAVGSREYVLAILDDLTTTQETDTCLD